MRHVGALAFGASEASSEPSEVTRVVLEQIWEPGVYMKLVLRVRGANRRF